jgi:hypothetical protein
LGEIAQCKRTGAGGKDKNLSIIKMLTTQSIVSFRIKIDCMHCEIPLLKANNDLALKHIRVMGFKQGEIQSPKLGKKKLELNILTPKCTNLV